MRTNVKNRSLTFGILMFIVTLIVGVTTLFMPLNKAKAEGEEQDLTFQMLEEAYVRLEDPSGIRFRVEIGADMKTTIESADEFGFLIFPQVYLTYDGLTEDYHGTLHGYQEMKVATAEEIASTIYTDQKTGKYVANGVLHTVKEANRALDFAAIAFYKTGDTYVYADFNSEFSRDLTYLAQQGYINNAEKRAEIAETFTWLTETTFEIANAQDLYELSAAVEAGATFQGIDFALTSDITVDCDYTPVASTFEGSFSYGDNTVTIINGGTTLTKAFAQEDLNTGVETEVSLLTVTENTTDRVKNGTFVENSELPNIADSNYTGDALKRSGLKNVKVEVTLNYTKDELQAFYDSGAYNKVTLSYYIDHDANVMLNDSEGTGSLFHILGNIDPVENTWKTLTIGLEDFISAVTGSKLWLMRTWIANSTTVSFNMYIGDIVLSDDRHFIPTADNATSVYFSGTHTYAYIPNAELPTTFEYVDNNSATKSGTIDNSIGYEGDAVKVSSVSNGNFWYLDMNYKASEYEAMMKDVYKSVTFYYMLAMESGVAEISPSYTGNGLNGIFAFANASLTRHKWLKAEIAFEDFLTAMYFVPKSGETADDNRLFMASPWMNSTMKMSVYIGEITFNKREVNFIPSADNVLSVTDAGWTTNYQSYYKYIANEELPTEGIDNTVGYTGDAIAMPAWEKSKVFLELDYTADEYTALVSEKGYTKATFSYLITSTCSSNNSGDLLGSADLTANVWHTVELDISTFLAAMTSTDDNANTLFVLDWASGPSSGYNINFYLGEIIFS